MKLWWTGTVTSASGERRIVEVKANARVGAPARLGGLPENDAPAEGDDIEIVMVVDEDEYHTRLDAREEECVEAALRELLAWQVRMARDDDDEEEE